MACTKAASCQRRMGLWSAFPSSGTTSPSWKPGAVLWGILGPLAESCIFLSLSLELLRSQPLAVGEAELKAMKFLTPDHTAGERRARIESWSDPGPTDTTVTVATFPVTHGEPQALPPLVF